MSDTKTKLTDPSRILTVANMISLLRAFLALPIIYTLQDQEWRLWTFLLILVGVISDALDGYFARKADEVTHFGKWMDPIADFICLTTVTFYLVLNDMFPMWVFTVYIFRYITIAVLAIYLINHSGYIISANWFGKWASGIMLLTVVLHIFYVPYLDLLKIPSMYIALVLLLISWMIYIKSLVIHLKTINNK